MAVFVVVVNFVTDVIAAVIAAVVLIVVVVIVVVVIVIVVVVVGLITVLLSKRSKAPVDGSTFEARSFSRNDFVISNYRVPLRPTRTGQVKG